MKYQTIIRKLIINPNIYRILRIIDSLKRPFNYFQYYRFPIIDIVNCGIPRSGSTLLSMIINEILQFEYEIDYKYVKNEQGYIDHLKKHEPYIFSKLHIYSPLIAKRIKSHKCIGFFTHRDIRDIIVSRVQKGWTKNIENYIKSGANRLQINDALLYANVNNINIISYFDLMNNTKDIIGLVSKKLNITLTEQDIIKIHKNVSISTSKNRIGKANFIRQGENLVDLVSGLHRNHINDPTIGKWREILTNEQIKLINENSMDYLDYFNYEVQ